MDLERLLEELADMGKDLVAMASRLHYLKDRLRTTESRQNLIDVRAELFQAIRSLHKQQERLCLPKTDPEHYPTEESVL